MRPREHSPGTATPDTDIVGLIDSAAKALPADHPWITLVHADRGDEVLNPAAVISGASVWARHFLELGARPGDRVIVCLRHSRALYLGFLGALMAGCVPSIYAPPSPKQRRDVEEATFTALLQASRARIAVLEPDAYPAGPGVSVVRPDDVECSACGLRGAIAS